MIIQDSSVHLSSQHSAVETNIQRESLQHLNQDSSGNRSENSARLNTSLSGQAVTVSLASQTVAQKNSEYGDNVSLDNQDMDVMGDLNMRILKAFYEKITGRQIVFSQKYKDGEIPMQGQQNGQNVRDVINFQRRDVHYEAESLSFTARGSLVTEDGKQIDFSAELSMSREFLQDQQIAIEDGRELKDPLVLNFSGNAAELTEDTFSFDIDADGTLDSISFVKEQSGFLFYDQNGDGLVNDGSELFGATTGNGFGELAAYDDDGNGWIDERDTIFTDLRVWMKDGAGNDSFASLSEKDVGALYLGSIESPFTIKDANNQSLGMVQKTGIFITEERGVGTLQQLDLLV